MARSLEQPGHRATYITDTLKNAKKRAWENDTKSGFVDVIRQFGDRVKSASVEAYMIAGVTAYLHKAEHVINFSNGSQIELFGTDVAADGLRGIAKHVYWIDEAQDIIDLESFYKGVVIPAQDFSPECWLTGTPGKDCSGMFYQVTTDDEDSLQGWEVHRIAAIDNPKFGSVRQIDGQWIVVDNLNVRHGPYEDQAAAEAAAPGIRWERSAGAAIRENGWKEDDPDLLREYFARWVKKDARYVYALHTVPEKDIVYAPVRLGDDGFPDIRAALLDLPGHSEGRRYFNILGADLGTRAAFAFVIWTWSLQDPILYELASWKKPGLDYDEMADYLRSVRGQINISMWTADAGGGGKPAVAGWSKKWIDRYGLPITEATKHNKAMAIKQLNNDIRKGLIKLREDGVLMKEWRVHRWRPLRTDEGHEDEDRTPHDASDAGLYGHRESYHHRYREPEAPPVPGSAAWVNKEEKELLNATFEEYG